MESGWMFPATYKDWQDQTYQKNNKNTSPINLDPNEELSNDLLYSQPMIPENEKKPKKKKKRRPDSTQPTTFLDKYTLYPEVLGQGANSLVTVAEEKSSQKSYAVKIIEKTEGYDRIRVLREIDLLHFLSECPNILKLRDSYEDSTRFYLVFERMEGGPLLKHIEQKTHFTEKEASLVVKDIAAALKFLHDKGIAHRDLKPDNILCVNENQIVPVVICDFNLASGISMIGSATTPELYTPVGSAEYMAPEIVDAFVGDAPAYDKRCDLWSLGVILFIMLSGKPPFEGNCNESCDWQNGGSCRTCQSTLWHSILDANFTFPPTEWENVSTEAKDLISHLLVKEASKRYSVEDVLNHPWLLMASNNFLNTPDVLLSEGVSHHLSTVTSEAVAYRRIISERQNSQDEEEQSNHGIISRWSTPPKFGLSPPGNSRLAKRRSLKQKLSGLSLSALATNSEENSKNSFDSNNTTPVQSPADYSNLMSSQLTKNITSSNNKEIT